jgi:superfamily II DNA or RNA helicase
VDLAARLRDRRHHALLPARAPGDKANRAPDWTALTPDDFLAALKTACRAESVPAAAVRETERRLAGGVLQARELHLVLLTVGRSDEWASVRQAALVALTERPDMAVTIVHLESQRLGTPAAFEEAADGAGFTARTTLTVDGQPVTGQPGRGVSKKTARQLAALSLVATLAGLPDPAGQTLDPDTESGAVGPDELLAAIRDGTPPAPRLAEGLAARRLSAQELHDLLLVADPVAWAAARKIAWEQLTRSPQLAGGVLSLYTQSRGQAPVRYATITDGVVVAVLPHHDWIQEGTHVGAPGRAATTRAAQAAAALALLADLLPPLADEDRVTTAGRNPLTELNERAQVGALTELGLTVTAAGPAHDPVFTCSATCRHADGEISGTGQGRTKAAARAAAAEALLAELTGLGIPAPPSHVEAVARYATSPAGVADRLLAAGCAIGYARGQFHLSLPDGWPLPEELPDLPVPAAYLLTVLARVRSQGVHPSVRAWAHLATPVLAAVARRDVYPAVDAAGYDRWALVLPDGVLAGEDGTLDEADAREFTDLVAEHLLRPPGAALVTGPAPYAGRPAQLPGEVAEWADRCAERADPRPGRPLTIRLHIQDDGITGELLPRDRGYPELRMARRARRVWPPLDDLASGPVRLGGSAVAPLAGDAGRELSSLGVRIEWPENVARGLVARAVLVPRAAGAVSAHCTVAVRWGLWLGEAALTEQESAAVAQAQGLIRMRGQWVVIDPASRDRARDPNLPAITGSQAVGAALTGQIQIGADTLDCAATGRLADLLARSRGPEPGEPDEPVTISGLKASLRHYQRRAVAWLAGITELGFGAVLADDMGLGKTLTIIAFHLHRSAGPTLVVCPASLLTNWEREIARFAPAVPVTRHHGAARDLNRLPTDGIVLTSYGTLLRDVDQFRGICFDLAVADEAQNIKNPRGMQAAALRELNAGLRVAVTGTPVENGLTDLWAILDWTNPGLFGTAKAFRATTNGESLNRLVGPFLLRRRKTDPAIAAELPAKIVSDHLVELTPEQRALYTAITRDTFGSISASSGIQRRGLILRMLQALRQVCNSPAHYLRERPDSWDADAEAARSGKLACVDDLLAAIAKRREAALIFTGYVSMAHLLAGHLCARGTSADIVHGGIPAARRQEIVDRFQSGEGECLILSVRAAGVGFNLTRADHVIHFDRHWNPAVEDQATDRAHRIGRRETVHVHHLIAENTVEDHIGELLRHKRAIADRLLTGDEMSLTELTDEELGQLVRLGAGGTP